MGLISQIPHKCTTTIIGCQKTGRALVKKRCPTGAKYFNRPLPTRHQPNRFHRRHPNNHPMNDTIFELHASVLLKPRTFSSICSKQQYST